MATMNVIHARELRPVCQREGRALRRFRRGEHSFAHKKDSCLKQLLLAQPRLCERRRCCLLNKVSLLGAAQKLQHVSAGNWAHQSQPLFE